MVRVMPFFLALTLPLVALAGSQAGGFWTFGALLVSFVVIPCLDVVGGMDLSNPLRTTPRGRGWDVPLYLCVPLQLLMIGHALWVLHGLSHETMESVGVILSTGVVAGGVGITVAHELMHRQGAVERAAAEILMTSVTYSHFCLEHVHGHHRRVATPEDPATSRFNESVYRFWLRAVVGGARSAWRIETQRVRRRPPKVWWSDRRWRYTAVLFAIYAGLGLIVSPWACWYLLSIGVVAFILLETINYIEHYGLVRATTGPGRYERVQPKHSWNASHRMSNRFLFNLARHSDHHYLASRPYERLKHYEDVPTLPASYSVMILVALVPPLWFRIMNPRVASWRPNTCDHAVIAG